MRSKPLSFDQIQKFFLPPTILTLSEVILAGRVWRWWFVGKDARRTNEASLFERHQTKRGLPKNSEILWGRGRISVAKGEMETAWRKGAAAARTIVMRPSCP